MILGRTLDQIKTSLTEFSSAICEPAVDYCAVKMPKWSFGKFKSGADKLGTAMKATGEAMALGVNFESALMKAIRSVDSAMLLPTANKFRQMTDKELIEAIKASDDERIFAVLEALARGISMDAIHEITMIDEWFLVKMKNITAAVKQLADDPTIENVEAAYQLGYTPSAVRSVTHQDVGEHMAAFKPADACAAEFETDAHYYYSTSDAENEAPEDRDCVLVIGAGAVTVGSGAEFDCCAVDCVNSLKRLGLRTAVVNNNSGAVSTAQQRYAFCLPGDRGRRARYHLGGEAL